MVRTQVQLTEHQVRRLRGLAAALGVSFSEALRRSLDAALDSTAASRGELYARAGTLIGAFKDRARARDLSTEHDRYLTEAFE